MLPHLSGYIVTQDALLFYSDYRLFPFGANSRAEHLRPIGASNPVLAQLKVRNPHAEEQTNAEVLDEVNHAGMHAG
eukprot:6765387-Pyramimonas_sp.AAC.2